MCPALLKKTLRDLGKRKVRTIFTILTISLGVMGVALFAVNPLADRTMADEVEKEDLYNLRVQVDGANLTPDEVEGLSGIGNVKGAEVRTLFHTKVLRGERRVDALLIGILDMEGQEVDRVMLSEGKLPGPGELLSERVNSLTGVYKGGAGDALKVLDHEGGQVTFNISGTGRSLAHGKTLYDAEGYAVFYGRIDDVMRLGNLTGYNYLTFSLESMDDEDVKATTEAIRSYLSNCTTAVAFSSLPEVRQNGTWPGGSFLEMFLTIMYVLTLLAIASSMFLISNTMNTVVSEQRKEIAMLKAVGATRGMVLRAYMTTALVMGAIGSILGAILGVLLSQGVLIYFGKLMGFTPGFMVHFPTVAGSIVVGLLFVLIASLPALVRSVRVPVREGMEERGIGGAFGKSVLNKALMAASFLPRTVDMGIRNAARRKGRSISAVLQIAIAVGIFLGLVAFGHSLGRELSATIDNMDYDIAIIGQQDATLPLNEDMTPLLQGFGGIDRVEPYLESQFDVGGQVVFARGYWADTTVKLHGRTMLEGRWFTPLEEEQGSKVVVIGKQLAGSRGIGPGDVFEAMTATGPANFEVIGVDGDFYYMGMVVYMPISALQDVLMKDGVVSGFYLRTIDGDHAGIDRLGTRLEDGLGSEGYIIKTDVAYQVKESTINQNKGIVNMITLTSGVIVLISMVGLTSNLTLNILDRTKEIGVLRCLGSVSSKIRAIFTSEAVFLSVVGWILGVPLGYLVTSLVSHMVDLMIGWKVTVLFPPGLVLLSLVLVTVSASLIAQGPIFRAANLRPGDALRYE